MTLETAIHILDQVRPLLGRETQIALDTVVRAARDHLENRQAMKQKEAHENSEQ